MKSLSVLKQKRSIDRFFRHPAIDAALMALIFLSVVLILVEFYHGLDDTKLRVVMLANDIITGIFIVELSLRWFAAPSTKAHFREYWIDWLSVIPFFRPIRVLRCLRAVRLLRLYRFGFLAHRFARTFEPRQYSTALREDIAHYAGPQADIILLMPDLFDMLSRLLEDARVSKEARQKICQAIAYFITPFDVLPEEVYGVEGYIDQCYVALHVLKQLQALLPDFVLRDAWEGEGTFEEILALLPDLEKNLLQENIMKVHRYLGLEG
jgi:uncharacterized membrane protein YkvA (DUF1232 family)